MKKKKQQKKVCLFLNKIGAQVGHEVVKVFK